MVTLVGGSGSSGTTLLRSYLNRHPDIFAGAELNFFNKQMFFDNWDVAKCSLISGNLKNISTNGWFPYPGSNILHPEYGWSNEGIRRIVNKSRNIKEFSDQYFSKPLELHGARNWVEKTPSNAYCFKNFLDTFSTGKVIHVVRNPYDTVASLVRRGMTEYFAAGVWVFNNSAAMKVSQSSRYLILSYENLVENPNDEFERVFSFLDIKYIGLKDLNSYTSEEDAAERKSSWQSSPSGEITLKGMGGFSRLDQRSQDRIRAALSAFRIPEGFASRNEMNILSAEHICHELGYSFQPSCGRGALRLTGQLCRDLAIRSIKRYNTMPPNYPGKLTWFKQ